MFYTRIPCPQWVGYSHEHLNKASRYFPFVGTIIGFLTFIVLASSLLLFPNEVAIIISMIVGILLTGAFHEDGFADVCDGFGGGYEKMRILEIMKDSRVGAYGVVGLILLFMLKFASINAVLALSFSNLNMHAALLLILISAHSVSRLAAVSIVFTHQYVREDALSKTKPIAKQFSWREVVGALFFGLLPLTIFAIYYPPALLALLPVAAARLYLSHYYTKWIGGYTGDCLGAVQQVCEVIFYLSIIALCKFI